MGSRYVKGFIGSRSVRRFQPDYQSVGKADNGKGRGVRKALMDAESVGAVGIYDADAPRPDFNLIEAAVLSADSEAILFCDLV